MKREQFGPYRLLRPLGRGRIAEVHEAENTITQRRVAVKIFFEWVSQDPSLRKRTQRNAPVGARVLEPHLVPIHDVGEIGGQLYVEMALIDGMDLQAILARDGPFSPARAVAIVGQIASALDTMHAAGLVSQNVTPGNILVTCDDFAYLLWFATLLHFDPYYDDPDYEPGLREYEYVAYCAPERFTGGEVTSRADVYAVTCVLYECLTGCRPYPGNTIQRQVSGHLAEDPPKPSVGYPAVPTGFDEVIAHGMAKKPEDRYTSAGDLARAARDALTTPTR